MQENSENSLVTQEAAHQMRAADLVANMDGLIFAIELAAAREHSQVKEQANRAHRYEALPETATFMEKMCQVLRGRTQTVR